MTDKTPAYAAHPQQNPSDHNRTKTLRWFAVERAFVCAALVAASWPGVAAQVQIPVTSLQFAAGGSGARATGHLKGTRLGARDYLLTAKAGQTMTVTLDTRSTSTYFNVLPPNSSEALYRGELDGQQHWTGQLPLDGAYRVRVFLNRAAGRKGVSSSFRLTVQVR
ncbi:hypothetical protein QS306_12605 [Paraburkholderia bonniea]|uniref:hypothetical protein n=1 Tax=Paraburkholderia bonniea TaxID=2152891 RepID=UPI001FEB3A98|nr:hypothetical protein [Paraburkholderia bonniea]WJF89931.1 hypothetical protein QS306_12605 [Paraburkholderia bonniea]WJF93245.1 hypothetical protein QS308_12615 [Paraburkholderia bonniea]